jgi:hypothetical protein
MWQAEIRRTAVPGQPWQESLARRHPNEKKLGMVALTCHSNDRESLKQEDCYPSWPGKIKTLSPK